MIAIYALCDPVTEQVRYVGKAVDPEQRLRSHMTATSLRSETHKSRWLRKLQRSGQRPLLKVLQWVDEDNWQEAERAWIAEYRAQNVPLTNATEGGEGVSDLDPESCERISQKAIARYARRRGGPQPEPAPHPVQVRWDASLQRWQAGILFHGEAHHVGSFHEELDALIAADAMARQMGLTGCLSEN